ncbi:MAG TPA: hypothetical protein VN238_05320, partial [Solirubrobacteraceae bacterium]|nr:hypothetical protein [Solirubrobacteraceae bacterium]
MLSRLRLHLTYANVVATLALLFAVSTGGAYAASKIRGKDIARNTITSANVKNGTLARSDFKRGVLPTGG